MLEKQIKPSVKGCLIAESHAFAICWWLLLHAQVWYCHTKASCLYRASAPPGGIGPPNLHKCSEKKNKDVLPTWVITVVSRWVSSWCDISSSFNQKSISHKELHSIQKKMHSEWEAAHSLPRLHTKRGPLPRHGPSSSHIFCRLLTSSNLLPSMHGARKAPSERGFHSPWQQEGSRRQEGGNKKGKRSRRVDCLWLFFSLLPRMRQRIKRQTSRQIPSSRETFGWWCCESGKNPGGRNGIGRSGAGRRAVTAAAALQRSLHQRAWESRTTHPQPPVLPLGLWDPDALQAVPKRNPQCPQRPSSHPLY